MKFGFFVFFIALVFAAAPLAAQDHGPRAGKIVKISDLTLEVVSRENHFVEIYQLGSNWGDLSMDGLEIGLAIIRNGIGRKLNCDKYMSGIRCETPKEVDFSKDKFSLEVYKEKSELGTPM